MRHHASIFFAAALGSILLFAPLSSLAVSPATVEHSTETDFATGKAVGVVLTSEGRLQLGRELAVRMPSSQAPSIVSAVAVDGQTFYVASGSDNVIYKVVGDKSETFATLDGTIVTSLLWTGQDLLAGTSGAAGAGVYRVDAQGTVALVWSDEGAQYIWAILRGDAGNLYVATGPRARVYVIEGGNGDVLYEASPKQAKNILCLVRDGDGVLYAGTDTTGLVLQIDPAKKTGRVLLSATEKEVAAIVLDGRGGLYAATSDTARATPEAARGPGGAAFGGPALRGSPVQADDMAPLVPGSVPDETTASVSAESPRADRELQVPRQIRTVPNDNGRARSKPLTGGSGTVDASGEKEAGEITADAGDANRHNKATSWLRDVPRTTSAPATASKPTSAPAVVPAQAVPSPATPPAKPAAMPTGLRGPAGPATGPGVDGPGNAVYHINADGLVRAVFRYPVSIYAMVRVDDALILGTGNNGQIFRIDLARDEIVMLADAESSQITALAQDGGQIYFGTANKGSVGVIGRSHALAGTFTSKAIDAQQIARWGTIRFWASVPDGTGVTVSTRTGNVAESADATWSEWSEPVAAKNGFIKIANPAGRFMQYQLAFTGDGSATASAGDVRVIYQVGNLAPVISAVQIVGGEGGPADGPQQGGRGQRPGPGGAGGDASGPSARAITIQASDPNGDALVYMIEYRELGTDGWITIAEKLDRPTYVWDTNTVGDGDYELRITASDSPANPPDKALTAVKVTRTVRVDNTPPVVKGLAARVVEGGNGQAASIRASGTAVDASRIAAIHYSLNSSADWVAVSPDSGICADTEEPFTVTIPNVKPGKYRLTIRVTDAIGNMGYASVAVNVGG